MTRLIKKVLERQKVFDLTLKILAFISKFSWLDGITQKLTTALAQMNVTLNKADRKATVSDLAHSWKSMMPPDGEAFFHISKVEEKTAYAEIHLHCPLRGTGRVHDCYKLMNYDRQLMDKVGGQLIVLDSQSNSGKNYCRLAIRKKEAKSGDLIPAHKK